MSHYWMTFPHASVTPKMHMLEDHMMTWLKKWKVGFGTMGEQGAESIHANFNGIETNMVHNRVQRLRCAVNEHYLRISPENVSMLPPIKRRKKSDTENHTSPYYDTTHPM